MKKIAVVLLNLGGPDSLKAVKPFLFNLFNDPAIIPLPSLFRYVIATLISNLRASKAKGIYEKMGGKSPLLKNTQEQATKLEELLNEDQTECTYKVFIAMRYWHPLTEDAYEEVKAWGADEAILLPLYPQYSTTTTGSSAKKWNEIATDIPTKTICCYPTEPSFIESHVNLIKPIYEQALSYGQPRVLFSAHGLPVSVIEKGDPYAYQMEQCVKEILKNLPYDTIDAVLCYQSRVGPKKWLEPFTESEIIQAAQEGKPLVIVPIAFVSDHSETLVELDMDYAELAKERGAPFYGRVPSLGIDNLFLNGLKKIVVASTSHNDFSPFLCPRTFRCCFLAN